ncbi:hypothetical protein GQX73_g605 [Xylaria multiplex]|uniref:Uncharacterized protein n=1 Tax=Xylaria multiplex TaxID=323545 RepID=A0A7C8IZE9_9PEZI|nr:hypothetical protein GQX73_g605 [Xylaria multiplex]
MAVSFPLVFLFLFVALRITPALGAVPRFGALGHARIDPFDAGAGFAPRWYMEGIPALPAQLFSPNPERTLGGREFGERDVYFCPAGQHSCVEANAPATCCDNDRYCYLNATWQTNCCALGNKCGDSLCNADELYCNTTLTTTIPATTTTTRGAGNMVTSIESVSTSVGCCNRACSDSSFSCEKTFGGQCCPYGYKCALGPSCIADPVPSTTMSISTIVPEIPSGCTAATQIACADGVGCCDSGSICTFQSSGTETSKAVCSPSPILPDDSGSSTGLSSGARAGIGIGVAVGAAIVIAAVTWFCIRRRRQPATKGTNASAHEMRRNTGTPGTLGGRSGGSDGAGNSLFVGPQTPHTHRSMFTDATDPTIPPLHEHGRAYSYHLPDAIAGPYTDLANGDPDHNGRAAPNPSLATTVPMGSAAAGSPPFHPDQILRPIEIGDGERQNATARGNENKPLLTRDVEPETGPFELVGSPLLNADEDGQPTNKGPK